MLKTWSIRNFCLWLSLWSLWLSNCRQHYTVELFVLLVFTLLLHDVHSADDHPQWVGIFKNIFQLGCIIHHDLFPYSGKIFFEFSVSRKTPCSKIPKILGTDFLHFQLTLYTFWRTLKWSWLDQKKPQNLSLPRNFIPIKVE